MVIVVGESLIDRITDAQEVVKDVVGGGPYNAARALASLGCTTSFIGGISSDQLGDRIREDLDAVGVVSLLPRVSAATGIAHVSLDQTGAASYCFDLQGRACADVTAADVRAVWPAQPPQAVHLGTLGLVLQPLASAVVSVVDSLDSQTLLIVDPNCRPSLISDRTEYLTRLDRLLHRADVVKVSADDLDFLTPGVDPVTAAHDLHAIGGAVVLVTLGAEGMVVLCAGQYFHIPAVPTLVVDTVGAGDVCGAAWLTWWLCEGLGRESLGNCDAAVSAAKFAALAAAWTCAHLGAAVPTIADLAAP